MRRRELFSLAAGAVAGCATIGTEPDGERYARLDRGLASVGNPFGGIAPRAAFSDPERAFVQSSLRSLLLAAAIEEASSESDPGLAERARLHAPDFDRAFSSARAIMQMPASDRIRIEREIRRDPTLTERVAEVLAQHARAAGVSGAGRLELRSMARQCTWRMQHQPISLLMHDTLERMRKVEARLGADSSRARAMLASAQSDAIAQDEGGYDENEELGEERKKKEEEEEEGEREAEEVDAKQEVPQRGKYLMIGGSIGMGGGLVLGAAGVGVAFASISADSEALAVVSILMCGIGALALVVGLVVLIVGIVLRVNDNREYGGQVEAP